MADGRLNANTSSWIFIHPQYMSQMKAFNDGEIHQIDKDKASDLTEERRQVWLVPRRKRAQTDPTFRSGSKMRNSNFPKARRVDDCWHPHRTY
jgi:hypothetical protein